MMEALKTIKNKLDLLQHTVDDTILHLNILREQTNVASDLKKKLEHNQNLEISITILLQTLSDNLLLYKDDPMKIQAFARILCASAQNLAKSVTANTITSSGSII